VNTFVHRVYIVFADKRVPESSERTVNWCQHIRHTRHWQEHCTGGIRIYSYHHVHDFTRIYQRCSPRDQGLGFEAPRGKNNLGLLLLSRKSLGLSLALDQNSKFF